MLNFCFDLQTEKGQVFGWGNSEYGQLNMATQKTQVNVARHLNLESQLGKVISVGASGSMCGLVNGEHFLGHLSFASN